MGEEQREHEQIEASCGAGELVRTTRRYLLGLQDVTIYLAGPRRGRCGARAARVTVGLAGKGALAVLAENGRSREGGRCGWMVCRWCLRSAARAARPARPARGRC